jgi:hypothetical protein
LLLEIISAAAGANRAVNAASVSFMVEEEEDTVKMKMK